MAMIISQLGLNPEALHGETVIVTGAGGGIGYEAARALLWLGVCIMMTPSQLDSHIFDPTFRPMASRWVGIKDL